jgi:hypothetical protein
MKKLLVCALLLCLVACTQKGWIDSLASADEQRMAVDTAQEFRDGAVDRIDQRTEPELRGDLARGAAEVRPILQRARGPFTIETVNVVQQSGEPITKTFTLQAGSGSSWAVAEIVFRGTPGSLQLAGFHAWPANSDPSKLNDFSISERGLLGYIWLLLMFGCVALCLTAVVLIWRRPWLKHRWLWTLGSLVGFTGFGLNWSTGAWAVLFLNVSLLGAGAAKAGPFSPWILTFGVPVIAIIVIVRFLREVRPEVSAE